MHLTVLGSGSRGNAVVLQSEGRALLATDPEAASDRLASALAEWHGPAYAQVADEPFAVAEIARLEDLRLRAVEDAFDAGLALGRHAEIVVPLAAHVAANPLREHARASLAGYKVPRGVVFIREEEMPRTATGKILHRVLRDRYATAAPRA